MTINKYEGKTFTKQSFVMDESFFLNCVLDDCDLFYSGGDVDWLNLKWEANCRWHFRGTCVEDFSTNANDWNVEEPAASTTNPGE